MNPVEIVERFARAAESANGSALARCFTEDGVYHDGFYGAFKCSIPAWRSRNWTSRRSESERCFHEQTMRSCERCRRITDRTHPL